jgi:hypothetical protein
MGSDKTQPKHAKQNKRHGFLCRNIRTGQAKAEQAFADGR